MWRLPVRFMPSVTARHLACLPRTMTRPVVIPLATPSILAASDGLRDARQPLLAGAVWLCGNRGEVINARAPDGLLRCRGDLSLAEARRPVTRGQSADVIELIGGVSVRARSWT